MQYWSVVAFSVVAILVALVSLATLDARMLPAAPWGRSVTVSMLCAAGGSLAWLLVAALLPSGSAGSLYWPTAVLAGLAAYLATVAVRAYRAGVASALLFASLWSVLVFVPSAAWSLNLLPFTPFGAHPVDHGASLAVNVASGAAVCVVLLLGGERSRTAVITTRTGVIATIGFGVGWLGWLAGAESALDAVTVDILINGVTGAAGGIAGWLIVQRIRHQTTTLNAVAAGLVSGLVSITAGAPLFTPVSAAATGIIAGGLACLFTLVRVGRSRRQQWFVAGSHLIAGVVGMVLLGVLATGSGFLFTGSTAFVTDQLAAVAVTAGYSAAISAGLWVLVVRVLPPVPAVAATRTA